MDYIYYVLIVLVLGLVGFALVRLATRSKNPDLMMQYEARKKATRNQSAAHAANNSERANSRLAGKDNTGSKSAQDRYVEKTHYRTPWGWPGGEQPSSSQGISGAVRSFADRLMQEKQLQQPGSGNGSIRALLEDRYAPVNKGMAEIPYQKVKRPLLRDPSEQHDQLDNLGSVEAKQLRKKLQFLSAMNNGELEKDKTNGEKRTKKVEFRYVELKDLKQPWGW